MSPREASEPAGPLNDWQFYHRFVATCLRPGMRVLEIGCGRGDVAPFPWERYASVRLCGIDPDAAARQNKQVGEFFFSQAGRPWPLPDVSFDLALARYVLEHVSEVQDFLGNVWRILKPGASLLFLTPNRRHPAALVSRFLPVSWKRVFLERTRGVSSDHVFPAHYRMNTTSELFALAKQSGFAVETLLTREFVPCAYMDFSPATRVLARVFLDLVTRTGLESRYGAHIIGCFRKIPAQTAVASLGVDGQLLPRGGPLRHGSPGR